jgi:hypothetical protein
MAYLLENKTSGQEVPFVVLRGDQRLELQLRMQK